MRTANSFMLIGVALPLAMLGIAYFAWLVGTTGESGLALSALAMIVYAPAVGLFVSAPLILVGAAISIGTLAREPASRTSFNVAILLVSVCAAAAFLVLGLLKIGDLLNS